MTRNECESLLAGFFARFGKTDFALSSSETVKTNIGEAILGFEFNNDLQVLECQAHIYRFRQKPRPEILAEIKHAEENGADTGGGKIDFNSQSLTLSLIRTYSESVSPPEFLSQMQQLAAASLLWSGTILNRVADRTAR